MAKVPLPCLNRLQSRGTVVTLSSHCSYRSFCHTLRGAGTLAGSGPTATAQNSPFFLGVVPLPWCRWRQWPPNEHHQAIFVAKAYPKTSTDSALSKDPKGEALPLAKAKDNLTRVVPPGHRIVALIRRVDGTFHVVTELVTLSRATRHAA